MSSLTQAQTSERQGRDRSMRIFPLRFNDVQSSVLIRASLLLWVILSLNFHSDEIDSQPKTSFDCENH